MAQWARDQVPFPGAAFRQVVEQFVRDNALMDGALRLGGREIDLGRTRGHRAQRDGREATRSCRWPRPQPIARARRRPERRDELRAARRPRDVRHRPLGVQATPCPRLAEWIAAHSDERRPGGIDDGDQAARAGGPRRRRAFLGRVPEGDRTFFKEDVDDPEVVDAWARPGTARAVAVEDGEVVGYVAVVPLHGWSSHVGEVRLIVDPGHRGRGIGRALARRAVLEAIELGAAQDGRRGRRRPGADDRDVPRRSGSIPRRC